MASEKKGAVVHLFGSFGFTVAESRLQWRWVVVELLSLGVVAAVVVSAAVVSRGSGVAVVRVCVDVTVVAPVAFVGTGLVCRSGVAVVRSCGDVAAVVPVAVVGTERRAEAYERAGDVAGAVGLLHTDVPIGAKVTCGDARRLARGVTSLSLEPDAVLARGPVMRRGASPRDWVVFSFLWPLARAFSTGCCCNAAVKLLVRLSSAPSLAGDLPFCLRGGSRWKSSSLIRVVAGIA